MRIFLTFVCIFFAVPAWAESSAHAFLGLSLGQYNTLDSYGKAAEFRMEYRPQKSFFFQKLKPWAGIALTSEAGFWAGGGVLTDITLTERLILTPSLGAGFYSRGNSEIDLDYPVQFRSQLELSYVFQNDSRFSLAFSHYSNAGLGGHNPGTEVLGLYYFLPI